jgi:hypothetical protein
MIRAVVKFWGSQFDTYGMPIPYHSYFVVASPWQTQDSGVASVVPLSTNAPLTKNHFLAQTGGERAAFQAAIEWLETEPGNQNLTQHVHEH